MKKRIIALSLVMMTCFNLYSQGFEDRGFIHPGGLHTQADFDRIKQQLADGDTKVTQAYNVLKTAAYAQSSAGTNPLETIVRGGGNGENYLHAARGAAIAYQNALRWKIEGNKACANHAVDVLMKWCNTTKVVTGNSDARLAFGLYGYEFAQAAELMRDYEGWKREDFAKFQRWMLDLWYPGCIGFLRGRNGTWENAGKWWQAPGHYWSNWGLCNVLCVVSIGILCDDVFIYNQGMSFFKYDQVGTFRQPRTSDPILNDGLTEFLGNLVVTDVESPLETGAYGRLGQMNESGRDTGHSAMALGLAVDIAKVGWNQGDDLFAYMQHRLASGIEYVAAQTQSVEGLPWTDYHYGSSGYYYSDSRSWLMTGPALGAQMRPYWGTVIGIYEGVKGVAMPFSEASYVQMGIDGGGQGSTSGGYDHLGYSVLMNTRDEQLCPAGRVPTELSPKMEYSGTLTADLVPSLSQERARKLAEGRTLLHNELGGLVNTFTVNNSTAVPPGQTLRLMPQLPEGEEDTGKWLWNTGERSREIVVETDKSFIYRVTYTNSNGIESQLCFPIAVRGDGRADVLTPSITIGTETLNATTARLLYGKSAKLSVVPSAGWGTYKWTGNKTTQEITTSALRKNSDFIVEYTNQEGVVSSLTFQLDVLAAQPYAEVDGKNIALQEDAATLVADQFFALQSSLVVDAGSSVTLGLTLPTAVAPAKVVWNTGETGAALTLTDIRESRTATARFTLGGEEVEYNFEVMVRPTEAATIAPGYYMLRHVPTDTYLTAHEKGQAVSFEARGSDDENRVWKIELNNSGRANLISMVGGDSLLLNSSGKTTTTASYPFTFDQAVGSDRLAMRTGSSTVRKYWAVAHDGTVQTSAYSTLTAFPFQLVAIDPTGIKDLDDKKRTLDDGTPNADGIYDTSGKRMFSPLNKAVYIKNGKKILVK